MENDTIITIDVHIEERKQVSVTIFHIIHGINNLTPKERWNIIGKLLRQEDLDLSSDTLTPSERDIIEKFLTEKLKEVQNGK